MQSKISDIILVKPEILSNYEITDLRPLSLNDSSCQFLPGYTVWYRIPASEYQISLFSVYS